MQELYNSIVFDLSKAMTVRYSTSFSLGIRLLQRQFRADIYAIYGFVRLADEIVDSFHDFDQKQLLDDFESDTFQAIEKKISINPVLHAFQQTVNKHQMDLQLVRQFLHSMRMDLNPLSYDRNLYEEYILGSAEVVGLMCLNVFCQGDHQQYARLKPGAMKLGAAFQKVNFLRDLNADELGLGRKYFPQLKQNNLTDQIKHEIEFEISGDFNEAKLSIFQLPRGARLGVYTAYIYYCALLKKIKNTPSQVLMNKRIRINNGYKFLLLIMAKFKMQFNLDQQ